MASIKTAISIQESLFEQVKLLADELNVSRSRIFVMAVEQLIERYQNQILLEEINQAYADIPDQAEELYLGKTRQTHLNIMEGEW